MSKKVLVEQVTPVEDGPNFGRAEDPADFMNSQHYAHAHTEQIVKDAIMAGAAGAQVAGFARTLPGGLHLNVAAGTALNVAGLSFDAEAATALTFAAAHITLPRIDLVYATLVADSDEDIEFRLFRRLRTPAELAAGVPPYTGTDINHATMRRTKAVVAVRNGMPNAVPVAPAAGAGEVALYTVRINAGATEVAADLVTDVRPLLRSLHSAWAQIDDLNAATEALSAPVVAQYLRGKVGGGTEWHPLGSADITGALDFTPVNKAGDDMTGPLTVAPTTHPTVATPTEPVKFFSGATVNLEPLFRVQGIETHAGGEAEGARAGLKLFLYGDNAGNDRHATLDWFTPAAQTWGRWLIPNGWHFHANELVANGQFMDGGAAFRFRSVSRASFGQNLVFAVADPSNNNIFTVDESGDVHCNGTLSKGAGTFLIDHPLDPNNLNLRYGFVEAPRYDLIYRGVIDVAAGIHAVVNIDAQYGMTAGTFAALTQNQQVWLYTNDDLQFYIYDPSHLATGQFRIAERAGAAGTVHWLVIGERADDYVKHTPECDGDGHLIVEFGKSVPTEEQLALLEDAARTEYINTLEGGGGGEETVTEIVPTLVGLQGYRMHAARVGIGTVPTRNVTVTTIDEAGE